MNKPNNFVVSWIDGEHNMPVEARLKTQNAALELGCSMSEGADATVELDDGVTKFEWRFEDGEMVDAAETSVTQQLGGGWTANFINDGSILISNGTGGVSLASEASRKLIEIIKGMD